LIVHGDDDQIMPIDASAPAIRRAGQGRDPEGVSRRPHGLFATHKEQFNADLLAFLREG
jgi:non-heme chloroperoxidase